MLPPVRSGEREIGWEEGCFFFFGCAGSSLLCVWAFSGWSGWELFFVAACGLLIVLTSLVVEHLISHAGSVVETCGP